MKYETITSETVPRVIDLFFFDSCVALMLSQFCGMRSLPHVTGEIRMRPFSFCLKVEVGSRGFV